MVRAIAFAAVLLMAPHAVHAQPLSVLHVKIVLAAPDGKTTPVPRHALLISDNPSTAAPRLVVTVRGKGYMLAAEATA